MNYYPTKSYIDLSEPQFPHLKQVVCATEDAVQMKWTRAKGKASSSLEELFLSVEGAYLVGTGWHPGILVPSQRGQPPKEATWFWTGQESWLCAKAERGQTGDLRRVWQFLPTIRATFVKY